MRGSKVLVTGGAGFIGSHLVDELVAKGNEVAIFDSFDPQVHKKYPRYINREAEIIRGDVCDKEVLSKALHDVDVVFHFAAAVGVGQSMYEISEYTNKNVMG